MVAQAVGRHGRWSPSHIDDGGDSLQVTQATVLASVLAQRVPTPVVDLHAVRDVALVLTKRPSVDVGVLAVDIHAGVAIREGSPVPDDAA